MYSVLINNRGTFFFNGRYHITNKITDTTKKYYNFSLLKRNPPKFKNRTHQILKKITYHILKQYYFKTKRIITKTCAHMVDAYISEKRHVYLNESN